MNKDFSRIDKEKFPPIDLADEIIKYGGNGRFGQINLIDKGGNIVVSIQSGIGGEVVAGTYTGAALQITNSEGREILSLRDDGNIYIGGNGVQGKLFLANLTYPD
jgi:hypothetical protein